MSSPSRPKSPHGVAQKKDDKEESFWDKIGTLGRKKKIKEGLCFVFRNYTIKLLSSFCYT
jgi:hypothetical protein